IDPQEAGLYLGQCAQYCGTQHAKMLLRVYAQSPEDFAAWIKQQQRPAEQNLSETPAAAEGQTVFMQSACINCHTVDACALHKNCLPLRRCRGLRKVLLRWPL